MKTRATLSTNHMQNEQLWPRADFGIDLFGFSLQSSIEARFIGFSLLASGFPRCEHAPLTNQ